MSKTKKCSVCNELKSLDEYPNRKNSRDGKRADCKICHSIKNKIASRKHKEKKALKKGKILKPYKEKLFIGLSDLELFDHIKIYFENEKRPPTVNDLDGNYSYPNYYTYYRKFIWNQDYPDINNWDDLIIASGLSPLDYKDLWRAWQYIVEICVSKIYSDYVYQFKAMPGYIPDFYVPSKNMVIDAMTSNYAHPHKKQQYENAKSLGYNIEFWCLNKFHHQSSSYDGVNYLFKDDIKLLMLELNEGYISIQIDNLFTNARDVLKKINEKRKELYIEKIQTFAKKSERVPKTRDFIGNPGYPSATSIVNAFGSFNTAILESGFEISREKLIEHNEEIAKKDLIELAKRLNRIPTDDEIGPPNTTYSSKVYQKWYGGPAKLLRENNIILETKIEVNKRIKYEKSLEQILKFYEKKRRLPKQKEFINKNSLPSYHWTYDNIGNLSDLQTLVNKIYKK